MATYYTYKLYCETEAAWVKWVLPSTDDPPTTCSHNTAHTVDLDSRAIESTETDVVVVDNEGSQKTVVLPTPGSEKNFYSPNMCDKCAWYPGSPTVTEEALTDAGSQTTYNSVNTYWIDVKHGRLFKEDSLLAEDPTLGVKVEVQTGGTGDWVEKTENSYGGGEDGDYSVDYEAGTVTFNDALGATDNVRASYHYADGYTFYIEPAAGKQLKVVYSEVQYNTDIVFNQNINFEFEAYNPLDPPNRVVVGGFKFKRLIDFFQESIGPYPTMPHHGGVGETVEVTGITNINTKISQGYDVLGMRYDTDWIAIMHGVQADSGRSMTQPLITVPFHYNAYKLLQSSIGLRIKISLETDEPLGGTFGNTTAYCLSEDDPDA